MKTILVVDDERDILTVTRLFLREEFRVLTAESGEEGLAILREQPVDLILSDQRMPGISGVEMLRQARVLRPEAIRILVTAYADSQASIDAINVAGVYKYIQKPWQPEDLLRTIRDCFA